MKRNFGVGSPMKKESKTPEEKAERKKEFKALPQKLASTYVKDMPRELLKTTRDVATGTKELVQKGVKAVGKGVKKVSSKVKNRKNK